MTDDQEKYRDLEKELQHREIKDIPRGLMTGFTDQVMEKIAKKKRFLPEPAWKAIPALLGAAAVLVLVSMTSLSLWENTRVYPDPAMALVEASRQTPVRPLTVEETILLVEEFEEADAENVWDLLEDESLLLEELDLFEETELTAVG